MVLRISPMVSFSPWLCTIAGSSESTTSASVPSSDKSLPRMISLVSTRCYQLLRTPAPSGSSLGKQRAGNLPALRRLTGREQRDQAARAVDQLQVGDEIAQLLDRLADPSALCPPPPPARRTRSRGSGASPPRTAGIRRCRERNSWLSESSTLMRSIPNAATTDSAARMSSDSHGYRSEISPIRSTPSARLKGGGCSELTSQPRPSSWRP